MKRNILIESRKKINIIDEFDAVVIGGGIAGVSAALAASRNGIKVCIIEKENCLGGLATLGLVIYYLPLCEGKGHQVIGGLGEELLKASIKYGPGEIPIYWNQPSSIRNRTKNRYRVIFNPASFTIALEELMAREKIVLFYDTRFCDVILKNNKINAILIENKSGRCAIICKYVVDASGDADVCFKSGEKTVSKTNTTSCWFYTYDSSEIKIHTLSDSFKTYAGDKWQDVSEMNIQSRKLVLKEIKKLRKKDKGLYPILIPTIPQFRMTRRLKSFYELKEKDDKKYFEDSIGMTGDWRKPGPIYYIPYKCLIGKKVKNLISAGRCISVSNKAWNITRAIPTCAVTGEAAGTAVALATKKNKNLCDLDITMLQNRLKKQNVIIDKKLSVIKEI